jgi:hypothetical protein
MYTMCICYTFTENYFVFFLADPYFVMLQLQNHTIPKKKKSVIYDHHISIFKILHFTQLVFMVIVFNMYLYQKGFGVVTRVEFS